MTMSPSGALLKKGLIFVHRWMGVCFCLLFLLWFTSGMAMMYWDYPEVTRADRLAHAADLDRAGIRISPADAFSRLQSSEPPDGVRLSMFDGRPVYRFDVRGDEVMVDADDGHMQTEFPPATTLRIAAAWAGRPPEEAKEQDNLTEDQWTVSGEFQELRPIRKYAWPDGQEVYVSTVTGDVVQYTTRTSRLGAYLGPIPHWLYFTPLRRHAERWSSIVIWASGLATGVALLGLIIGVWMYSPTKPFRHGLRPSSIPYLGQKRWHMILGLTFGPLACTWAFSGMLSMDPFPQLQSGTSEVAGARIEQALRGTQPLVSAFAAKLPQEALAEIGSGLHVKEFELTSFAGEPVYLASATPDQTRVVPVRGAPAAEFDRQSIIAILREAAQPAALSEVRMVTEYEAYYLDRHHLLPLPVIFVQLDDTERSAYYVDPKTARVVQSYDSASRRNRWVYHGLHSINLPWLYRHRPAWDIAVLTLLLGGASLSFTSLLLAWRVLRRRLPNRA